MGSSTINVSPPRPVIDPPRPTKTAMPPLSVCTLDFDAPPCLKAKSGKTWRYWGDAIIDLQSAPKSCAKSSLYVANITFLYESFPINQGINLLEIISDFPCLGGRVTINLFIFLFDTCSKAFAIAL